MSLVAEASCSNVSIMTSRRACHMVCRDLVCSLRIVCRIQNHAHEVCLGAHDLPETAVHFVA